VAICLLDLTDLSSGLRFEGPAANDIFAQQVLAERTALIGPLRDLENNLRKAVATDDVSAIADCVRYSDALAQQNGGKTNVARILWNIIIEASSELADLIFSSLSCSFDFQFVDDINGRTCLHEAAIAGSLSLVDLCIQKGVRVEKTDLYGRTALHYASMHGRPTVCQRLLAAGLPPNTLDRDNYTPLVYATMRGSVDCVRVLLDEGHVSVEPTPLGDLIPLSLASQSGHVDVVSLLLEHGAHCLANSNGEYPMHLAAREGHPEVCKYFLHLEGWDVPDKYYEWTPLFHAARYGRAACVQILLDAGARLDARDELGHLAVHYAAWYGHHECLSLLLDATKNNPSIGPLTIHNESPLSDFGAPRETMEIDLIPSLSLPPPIMPHRVYGHNYLDRSNLVQVTIGRSSGGRGAGPSVRLHHRLINPALEDEYILASAPLKLVMTTSPSVNSAPYCISLPQRDQKGVFSFQISSVDTLSLEFSVYPNFGTKTIGRAVALPSLFEGIENNQAFTLPILDTRLHVIGEVNNSFILSFP
jgi:CDK inhibitor PHO81